MFVVKNTTNEIGKSICFPRSFGILRVVIGVRHLWRAAAEGEIPEEKPARGGERATRARQNQGEINFCSFFSTCSSCRSILSTCDNKVTTPSQVASWPTCGCRRTNQKSTCVQKHRGRIAGKRSYCRTKINNTRKNLKSATAAAAGCKNIKIVKNKGTPGMKQNRNC